MDIIEIERRISIARDRVATLRHRADDSEGGRQMLLDTLQELQTSMEELNVTVEELHQQNEQLAATEHAIAMEQERYRDLFEFAPIGYLVTTPEGAIRDANRAAVRMFNLSAKHLRGKPLITFVEPDARASFRELLFRVQNAGRALEWAAQLHPRRSLPFSATVIVSAAGNLLGRPAELRWIVYDVTVHRRAEEQMAIMNAELERQVLERTVQIEAAGRLKDDLLRRERAARNSAEAAQERLALVAAASSVLNRSLDPEVALKRVATLALPLLGDWCFVDVFEENGSVRRVAVAHADPAHESLARELQQLTPRIPAWTAGEKDRAAHWPQSELVGEANDQRLQRAFPDPRLRKLLAALHPLCWMRIPLVTHGEMRGLVTLLGTQPGRRYGPEDLTLAEDLVSRGAAAVEQARLFKKVQEANQTKSGFLATMSHELRTPLNAIIGYAELLLLGIPEPLAPDAERQVGRIRSASQHLLSMIEEILSFSRIEAGSTRLFVEPLRPSDIASDAASLVEPMARAKGLTFTVDVPVELPVVESDAGKLRQILVNLLSNAVKFTAHGEVTLAARAGHGGLAFVVRDTGVGIPKEHQERVFEAFWQVRYPAMQSAGGTGLGLSVSRQLARLLGGEVTVESTMNQGSTFTVWLPLRRNPAAERSESPSAVRAERRQPAVTERSSAGAVDAPTRGERTGDLPHAGARAHRLQDDRHELGA